MKNLPEHPPDRATSLADLEPYTRNPDIQSLVAEYNKRYLYWDELRYRITDEEKRYAVWAIMKLIRALRYEYIPSLSLDVKYSTTPEITKALHMFDRYLSGTIQIHNKTIRMEQSYVINSLMEEAIASSILEGAATTRTAAKNMLRKGRKPTNESEQMVINNYEAMRCILDKKDEPLTPELILEIHRLVTRNTIEEESVGRFRNRNDIVVANPISGTIYHTPPDYHEIEQHIDELCTFANLHKDDAWENDTAFVHPIISGIILHFLIGYIHPFNDGNGRTARSIFYWYVLSRGYWLLEYMPISRTILKSKKKYSLAYLHSEYDDMDVTYFINYNIACLKEALKDFLSYLERKQSEQNATKAIIRNIREINQRQADILREMMERSDEYFTIREIEQMYDVVYQTARTDLLSLVNLGYVVKEKRGKEFVFIFNEKCDLWNDGSQKDDPSQQKQLGDYR
ncbi:MAG TPA: Fic family protein [Methanoculleus sp.]|nr:Fic family protein [Methanoculleus sp.]